MLTKRAVGSGIMLNKLKIDSKSIFPKLILTFLLITTPLFALSLTLNELGKQEVRKQNSNTMTAQIHYYFMLLEREVQQIIKAQQEMVNDEELQNLSSLAEIMTDYQRSKAINGLYKKLKLFKESNAYIQDASIYIPSVDGVISTTETADPAMMKEEMKDIARAIYKEGFPLTFWKNRFFLNLTYPHYLNGQNLNKPPLFIQNAEISVDAMKNVLDTFHKDGGAVLFSDDWSIANDKGLEYFPKIKKRIGYDERKLQEPLTQTVSIDKVNYVVTLEKSQSLNAVLMVFIPEETMLGTLNSYRTWFWLLVCSAVIIVVLFSYGIYLLIHRPMRLLIKMFKNVEEGNFHVSVMPKKKDEFGYLYSQFDKMVRNLKILIDELYVQKIRLQQAELKQLQAQINPHFLYNSYFTLHQLIKMNENDVAELVSKHLGDYFQYITRNAKEVVPLETEINHIRSYIEIQNIRFSNRIKTVFEDLPEPYRQIPVPRLILQPVIENAYHHGLGEKVFDGQLRIRYRTAGDKLCITVEDNGPGLDENQLEQLNRRLNPEWDDGESTGLINVHRRLQLKYGLNGGIEIARGEMGGLLVHIFIQLERGE